MHVRHSRGGETKAKDGLEICGLKRRTENDPINTKVQRGGTRVSEQGI